MFTLVTGGVRSGRSNYALRRASELGPPPWLYVGTGQDPDPSVQKLMARHRADEEAIWRTATMPADLRQCFAPKATEGLGALVLDGFFWWLGQRLAAGGGAGLLEEVGEVAELMYRSRLPIVVVTTEIVESSLPEDPEKRRRLEVATSANQILATLAQSLVLMVNGVPLRVR
jgi:adenosylcobinamide kinase/adenosylcobinamide-phosphate guanylyltransferase